MRVAAMLADDDVRSERGRELREQRLDGAQPGLLAGARLERHVDGRAGGWTFADLRHGSGARKEVSAALVERDREDARIVPVDRLDAVAVMDVEIDVEHAQAGQPRLRNRDGRIVVDAKSRRPRRHRVMKAAARVEGVQRGAAENRLHGPDRAASDGCPRVVHARKRRVVTRSDPRLGRAPRVVVEL